MKVVHQELNQEILKQEINDPKQQVDTLYIEADEDYVAHQDVTNRFMKLVWKQEALVMVNQFFALNIMKGIMRLSC